MDLFDSGNESEVFMGRWSRLIAGEFVQGLGAAAGLDWLDVGCGTGALIDTVLDLTAPRGVAGVDPSHDFVDTLRTRLGARADIRVAGGEDLPFNDDTFDVVVSGLALNFIPDPLAAVIEWGRVSRPSGSISAYVWDYAHGMEFLRIFWDAVVEMDPTSLPLDEAVRFPICRPDRLSDLFKKANMSSVALGSVETTTAFRDFDDYWRPFTRGQGPAPGYVAALSNADRNLLEGKLRSTLRPSSDGTIRLSARALTVTGSTA